MREPLSKLSFLSFATTETKGHRVVFLILLFPAFDERAIVIIIVFGGSLRSVPPSPKSRQLTEAASFDLTDLTRRAVPSVGIFSHGPAEEEKEAGDRRISPLGVELKSTTPPAGENNAGWHQTGNDAAPIFSRFRSPPFLLNLLPPPLRWGLPTSPTFFSPTASSPMHQ